MKGRSNGNVLCRRGPWCGRGHAVPARQREAFRLKVPPRLASTFRAGRRAGDSGAQAAASLPSRRFSSLLLPTQVSPPVPPHRQRHDLHQPDPLLHPAQQHLPGRRGPRPAHLLPEPRMHCLSPAPLPPARGLRPRLPLPTSLLKQEPAPKSRGQMNGPVRE